MKHRKKLSAFLSAALTLSLCGGVAIATQTAPSSTPVRQAQLLIAPAPTPQATQDTPQAENTTDDAASQTSAPVTDPEGTVSFCNVAQRVREGNLTARALGSSIAAIEALDYEEMSEDIRSGLNQLAQGAFALYSSPSMLPPDMPPSAVASAVASSSVAANSLQSAYDSLRVQFDAIQDGDLQQENADTVRMLKNTQNQMAMAGESLYIALVELQQSNATLQRNLNTLERSLAELDIRYEMGQVSSMTLQETQSTKTSLLSTQQTLLSNHTILTYQLQSMLGEELSGQLTLAPLPAISQDQLASMDLEADLAKAKAASYSLYDAKKALDEAEDTYGRDACRYTENAYPTYKLEMSYHQLEAAKHTYEAAVQSFELGLRTLYHQIKDYQQVLNTAKSTLSVKQSSYAAAQIKYEQGVISKFDLLDAQDAVSAAQDAVDSAAIDLFSTYTNYRWAVDYGILN